MEAKKVSSLLVLLHVLEKFGITDSSLEKSRGLSRMSLRTIRNGGDLPRAHQFYFKELMGVLNGFLLDSRREMDVEKHRYISNKMLEIFILENDLPDTP